MIATISPAEVNHNETLRYGNMGYQNSMGGIQKIGQKSTCLKEIIVNKVQKSDIQSQFSKVPIFKSVFCTTSVLEECLQQNSC